MSVSSVWSRIDIAQLWPPFLAKLQAMISELEAAGASYFAVSGFRSYAEQERLWAQGRSTPGDRVTDAHGGESSHNFGIAVDFTRDGHPEVGGLQPDFRPALYAELGVAAKQHGLVWGGDFESLRDRPHVQVAGFVSGAQLEPLRFAYDLGGLPSVWQYLDAQGV